MRDALGAPDGDPEAGHGTAELELYADGTHAFATGTFNGELTVACSRCVEPGRSSTIDEPLRVTFMPRARDARTTTPTTAEAGADDDDGAEVGRGRPRRVPVRRRAHRPRAAVPRAVRAGDPVRAAVPRDLQGAVPAVRDRPKYRHLQRARRRSIRVSPRTQGLEITLVNWHISRPELCHGTAKTTSRPSPHRASNARRGCKKSGENHMMVQACTNCGAPRIAAPRLHELRPVPRRDDHREEGRRERVARRAGDADAGRRRRDGQRSRAGPRGGRCAARRRAPARTQVVLVGDARGSRRRSRGWAARRRSRSTVVHATRGRDDGRSPGAGVSHEARLVDARRGRARRRRATATRSCPRATAARCSRARCSCLGRLPGIERPAIVTVLPTPSGPLVLCDAGGNVEPQAVARSRSSA